METKNEPLAFEAGSAKALSAWGDFLHSLGMAGKLSLAEGMRFSADRVHHKFGKSNLIVFQTEAFTHERSRSDCASNPSDFFCLSYVRNGKGLFQQGNRETTVGQGDSVLVYSAEPCCRRFVGSYHASSLLIPRAVLQSWLPFPFDLTAVSLSKASPFGKTLGAVFEALALSPLDHLAVAPDSVTEQICCLLALIAGPPKISATTYKEASFYRFRRSLQDACADPDFNESSLALQHGVSTRTIQTTFSRAGTSFRRELLITRMERARWFLDDPRYDKKSVDEISGFLGYRHAGLFITHFRRKFGTTPHAYRNARRT